MSLNANKGELSSAQKLDYLIFWFREFSELQKGDFLEILVQKYDQEIELGNGSLTNGFQRINLTKERPTIFTCRMKLFGEWFNEWNETQRLDMLERFRHLDSDFVERFERALQTGKLPSSNLYYSSYEISDELYDELKRVNDSINSQNSMNSLNGNGFCSPTSSLPDGRQRNGDRLFGNESGAEDDPCVPSNGHSTPVISNGVTNNNTSNGSSTNGHHHANDSEEDTSGSEAPMYNISASNGDAIQPEPATVGV